MTDEDSLKFDVFYVVHVSVIVALVERFRSTETICSKLSFLWLFPDISSGEVTAAASMLGKEYPADLNGSILSSNRCTTEISRRASQYLTILTDGTSVQRKVPHTLLNELAQNGLEEV